MNSLREFLEKQMEPLFQGRCKNQTKGVLRTDMVKGSLMWNMKGKISEKVVRKKKWALIRGSSVITP